MHIAYYVRGESTRNKYAVSSFLRVARTTAESLSKTVGERVRVEDAEHNLVDLFDTGRSLRNDKVRTRPTLPQNKNVRRYFTAGNGAKRTQL